MTKVFNIDCQMQYEVSQQTVFMLNILAAKTPDQRVLAESITTQPYLQIEQIESSDSPNRLLRIDVPPGPCDFRYLATVEVNRPPVDPWAGEAAVADLPAEVLPYLTASRYCESDVLFQTAAREFGHLLPGFARVQAICDWIRGNLEYRIGSSHSQSTASDVIANRAGVCRDFAHVAISFCRALNIPARFVTGYAQFQEPPPDFHAAVEAYVGGAWHLFDPTQLSPMEDLVRIGTGTDASEVPFATLFGAARMRLLSPLVGVPPQGSFAGELISLQQPGDGILLVA